LLGSGANEIDMGAVFEDEPGGLDGVAEAFDTGDTAGLHAAPVHEKSVALDAAIGGEEAAPAGVEGGIVFQDGDGGFDSVEGTGTAGEKKIAGFEGAADAKLVFSFGFWRNGPGTAVDEEGGAGGDGAEGHGNRVTRKQGSGIRGKGSEVVD
jgi:hypothetical protein